MECDYDHMVELVYSDDTAVQEGIDGVPVGMVEGSSGLAEGLLVGGPCNVTGYWQVDWSGTEVYIGMGSLQTSALGSSSQPFPLAFEVVS